MLLFSITVPLSIRSRNTTGSYLFIYLFITLNIILFFSLGIFAQAVSAFREWF